MKFLRLLLAALVLGAPGQARAVEHRYDVVAKLLTPFISLLAKTTQSPNRALLLTARLERLTDLPPELAGAKAELALQYPDKLRLHAPLLGEVFTVCRNGQQIWAAPGSKLQTLLDAAVAEKRLPKPDPKYRLEPFRLPLPDKQLVLLPALLQVQDGGMENVAGKPCRVLTLSLMPELERSLELEGWRARVWVDAAYKPARLIVAKPGWELAVRFETVEFSPRLPATTWRPGGDDVIEIDAPRFQQLMQAIVR
ncbi:MAG: hypothetical protein JWQ44_2508 [Chthoniobacter sp.]|nr:hypothetical protein [Chthoniobacter sp.]